MADGTVGVKQADTPDRLIDNETLTVSGQTVFRQRVQVPEAVQTRDLIVVPKGYQQLQPTMVTALTVPPDTIYALLQARGADVSYRDDGVAPTTSVGMRLVVDTSLFYTGDLVVLQFIGSGTLDVLYYGVT